MTTTEALMHFETETVDGISRTRCFDANREELAGSLNFAESAWRSNQKKCIAAASLPLVRIPAALDAMPADLLILPDDAQIVARREIARYDTVAKAGKVRAEVADAIERRAAGLFTAREVAFLLEQQRGPRSNRDTLFKMLADAIASGKLVTFDPDEDLPSDATRLDFAKHILGARSLGEYLAHGQYLRLDVVNQWLASTGTARRLQPPAALAAHAAVPVVSSPAVAAPEPVAPYAEDVPQVASWTFTQSVREKDYGADLNDLLEKRHKSGEPIPTAADVIEIWKANLPRIFRVVGVNLEYRSGSGGTWKVVREKSLNEAIKKRTSA